MSSPTVARKAASCDVMGSETHCDELSQKRCVRLGSGLMCVSTQSSSLRRLYVAGLRGGMRYCVLRGQVWK